MGFFVGRSITPQNVTKATEQGCSQINGLKRVLMEKMVLNTKPVFSMRNLQIATTYFL